MIQQPPREARPLGDVERVERLARLDQAQEVERAVEQRPPRRCEAITVARVPPMRVERIT